MTRNTAEDSSRVARETEGNKGMMHTFAVCAYGESPYLEACLKSLKAQTVPSEILICTSTPSAFLDRLSGKYGIPVKVRKGTPGIGPDWNFAFDAAGGRYVTLAHQDDIYGKHYTETLERAAAAWPDMTIFTTASVTIKNGRPARAGLPELVKLLLRMPLRLKALSHLSFVKRLALSFGNPVICPSCAYLKEAFGSAPFAEDRKFVLDWQLLYDAALRPGRLVCEERPLILYRVHKDAATAKCIGDHVREAEEEEMFRRIWPARIADLILHFYRRSYEAYEEN